MRSMERAAGVAEDVAERLAIPDDVIAIVDREIQHSHDHAGGSDEWQVGGLGAGSVGLAVLFDEMARIHPHWRRPARRYLQMAADGCRVGSPGSCLYQGTASVAYAVRMARKYRRAYTHTLEQLDLTVETAATARVDALLAREEPVARTFHEFDVIDGLAGAARYLLLDGGQHRQTLERILSYLVGLNGWRQIQGVEVPGWWVDMTPTAELTEPGSGDGHVNLGVAHGICGPLALMAIAWQQGFRIPGQREAMSDMCGWLMEQRYEVDDVACWPGVLSLAELREGANPPDELTSVNLSWCYGTPGIARALQLAGKALGRDDIVGHAVVAVESVIARSEVWRIMPSACLCHGWAGLLHTLHRIAQDSQIAGGQQFLANLSHDIIESRREDAPFLYRSGFFREGTVEESDDPTFLNGAAGIALALWGYAHGLGLSSAHWDTVLMLS